MQGRRYFPLIATVGTVATLCLSLIPRAQAQDDSGTDAGEVAVNQAAGRVVVAVVKNAIIICTSEDPIEPGTRVPTPTQLSSLQAGTLLGAVEWVSPSLQKTLGRLDNELPHLRARMAVDAPRLSNGAADKEASDIEAIGTPVRERLGELAANIHGELNWSPTDPVLRLIITDYLDNYGPEVWQLTYTLSQEQQKGDYWVTNIEGPVYLQIWPPEKGQPHTLMEFDYPDNSGSPNLLDLLRRKDSRLDGLTKGDAKLADVAGKLLTGDSLKINPSDATQFLRAAMAAITPSTDPQTVAIVRQETGFDWILAPPAEPKPPKNAQPNRDTGAPSLSRPSSDDSEQAPSLAHPPH